MLKVFTSGPFATNAYLLISDQDKQAAAIDPAPGSAPAIISYIESHSLELNAILLTHTHWDHIADVKALKERYPIPVYVHVEDRLNLEKPGSDRLPLLFSIPGVVPEFELKEGDMIQIGNYSLRVIHTPGHSPGSVCFYDAKAAILISGDTLFQGTIGNLSFPTSNADQMWLSLDKLAKLPPATQVYPGHGETTTIGAEKWLPQAKDYFGG